MEMRQILNDELSFLMEENENIIVIDSDLSKPNGLYSLKEKFPLRTIDVGIAEQNMACIAAGMSSYGFIPFISTFAAFATRRICDQIAVSCSYAKQNVKIIGTDPGICAEFNGGTHMSFEDIGVLRSIPNIIIFEPADAMQLKKALPQIVNHYGVVYIRMNRKRAQNIFPSDYKFDLFKASKIQDGTDISIFCSGIMVHETLKANKILQTHGINADIINIHTIKPIDKNIIINSVKKTGLALTVENHNIIGGLRSAISELLIENYPIPLKSIGVHDQFGQVGKISYLKKFYKMRDVDIVEKAIELIKLKK